MITDPPTEAPLPAQDFAGRRQRLAAAIGDRALAVISAAPQRPRNGDVLHPYRQDSDFLYLTGLLESDMVLVIAPGSAHGDTLLFCRPAGEREARYDGYRLTPDDAPQHVGVDAAFDLEDLDTLIPALLEGRDCLHYLMGSGIETRIPHWTARSRASASFDAKVAGRLEDLGNILHEMRLIKDETELARMRRAAAINHVGHRRAMASAAPATTELRLEAELRYGWALAGAAAVAYPPIVAAGANACVMHYHDARGHLADGDLVLIDAGPEYDGYASDVTRTFPANGRFSAIQGDVYDIVLAAQQAAIAAAQPGNAFDAPQQAGDKVLVDGLRHLGVLQGSPDALLAERAHTPWAVHRLSHWLGLDVHDVGRYDDGQSLRTLQAGMVLTIEPGLYFPAAYEAPAALHGIGVRIEDDVLITAAGNEVLTASIPTTRAAVETWVQADV